MTAPRVDVDAARAAATRAGTQVVARLWEAAGAIDRAGFSLNPLDVATDVRRAVELVDLVRRVATEPPPGDPEAGTRAAAAWRDLARALERGAQDVRDARAHRATAWTGRAAQDGDATLGLLEDRLRASVPGARRAAAALEEHADRLAAAQRRYDDVGVALRGAAADLPRHPADLGRLDGLVPHLRAAVTAATESWRSATDAAGRCAQELVAVRALMPFPDGTAPGMRAIDVTALHAAGAGRPPLVGDILARARDAHAGLDEADRAAVDALLEAQRDARAQAWLLALLATGAPTAALRRLATRLQASGRPADELLDPARYVGGHALAQSTGTTCGSSSLVMARMLRDPAVALWVLDGYDVRTGASDARPPQARFAELEARTKARTDDPRKDPDAGWDPGNLSAPWPPALGTSPWAAAEELGALTPAGTGYGVRLVGRPADDRGDAFDVLVRAGQAGHPAALYVGDAASPRHVVLVLAGGDDAVTVYEPGAGRCVPLTRERFVTGSFSLGGWDRPWAVVAP